jgi:hypothetical protein
LWGFQSLWFSCSILRTFFKKFLKVSNPFCNTSPLVLKISSLAHSSKSFDCLSSFSHF